MPGLGLTKLELFKWLSGKNLPLLKIHFVTFHYLYIKMLLTMKNIRSYKIILRVP